MRHWLNVVAVTAAFAAPTPTIAQETDVPPAWMTFQREVIKPGKEPAHLKLEREWARAYEAQKYPNALLGMTSMSGPSEVWFLMGYQKSADIQKVAETVAASPALSGIDERFRPQESDLLANQFTMVARFRGDLSYSNNVPMASMRYMTVQRIVVKIGHGPEFEEARKLIKAAHEQSRASDGFAVYQVTAGAPAGTFLVLAAKRAMADFDNDPHGAPYIAALGGPDGQKKLREMSISYENSADTQLFAVNPEISTMGAVWGAADSYWKSKAAKK
ncbi:MAG: hypothetical protein HY275_12215 [Gemmatimonadetes bacterium]|nr:hypothetical protein [Gemmatimonadota bacterium]